MRDQLVSTHAKKLTYRKKASIVFTIGNIRVPMRPFRLALVWFVSVLLTAPAANAGPEDGTQVGRIIASQPFRRAVQILQAEHDRTVADIIALTEIPAPPFQEAARARAYLAMLQAHGLSATDMDAVGNVMGVRPGTRNQGRGPYIVMAAHLDTVFPQGTDVRVRRDGDRLSAPGIGDDTRSLAVMLAYIRALDAAQIRTQEDILFVGNVGEEGLGNLRGVRHLFEEGRYAGRIKAFFSMDVIDPDRIVNRGVGSKRYRATFRGPGGHSYDEFGIVNPMAAMARAVVDLYALSVPAAPKTTYSASVVGGGTSVNSIPGEVFADFDLRSESADALANLDLEFKAILTAAVAAENERRSARRGEITLELKAIGDRPAGGTAADAWITQVADAAVRAHGFAPNYVADSTDANLPMSLGIPALTIGSGGAGGRSHSLEEWIDVEPTRSVHGMSVGLATLLASAGVDW